MKRVLEVRPANPERTAGGNWRYSWKVTYGFPGQAPEMAFDYETIIDANVPEAERERMATSAYKLFVADFLEGVKGPKEAD